MRNKNRFEQSEMQTVEDMKQFFITTEPQVENLSETKKNQERERLMNLIEGANNPETGSVADLSAKTVLKDQDMRKRNQSNKRLLGVAAAAVCILGAASILPRVLRAGDSQSSTVEVNTADDLSVAGTVRHIKVKNITNPMERSVDSYGNSDTQTLNCELEEEFWVSLEGKEVIETAGREDSTNMKPGMCGDIPLPKPSTGTRISFRENEENTGTYAWKIFSIPYLPTPLSDQMQYEHIPLMGEGLEKSKTDVFNEITFKQIMNTDYSVYPSDPQLFSTYLLESYHAESGFSQQAHEVGYIASLLADPMTPASVRSTAIERLQQLSGSIISNTTDSEGRAATNMQFETEVPLVTPGDLVTLNSSQQQENVNPKTRFEFFVNTKNQLLEIKVTALEDYGSNMQEFNTPPEVSCSSEATTFIALPHVAVGTVLSQTVYLISERIQELPSSELVDNTEFNIVHSVGGEMGGNENGDVLMMEAPGSTIFMETMTPSMMFPPVQEDLLSKLSDSERARFEVLYVKFAHDDSDEAKTFIEKLQSGDTLNLEEQEFMKILSIFESNDCAMQPNE